MDRVKQVIKRGNASDTIIAYGFNQQLRVMGFMISFDIADFSHLSYVNAFWRGSSAGITSSTSVPIIQGDFSSYAKINIYYR